MQMGGHPARDLDLDDFRVRSARDALAGSRYAALDQGVRVWTGELLSRFEAESGGDRNAVRA